MSNKKLKTRFIANSAIATALVFAVTAVVAIPIPATKGYFNFGDSVIMILSVIYGPIVGMISGGVGSMFADLLLAPAFAPYTLVVKMLEGLFVGIIAMIARKHFKNKKTIIFLTFLGMTIGALIMMLGYFLTAFIITKTFEAAIAETAANALQGGVSVAIATFILLSYKTIFDRRINHNMKKENNSKKIDKIKEEENQNKEGL